MRHIPYRRLPMPVQFLTEPRLSLRVRGLFMLLHQQAAAVRVDQPVMTTSQLMGSLGYGQRRTFTAHLEQLAELGWLQLSKPCRSSEIRFEVPPKVTRVLGRVVMVPITLITSPSLSAEARLLYAFMLSHPEGRRSRIVDLAKQIAGGRELIRRRLSELENAGWLAVQRHGARGGSSFIVKDQHRQARLDLAKEVQAKVDQAPFRGEALLKAVLDELVQDSTYVDNARPGTLSSPDTDEKLELDRWYPIQRVGIEFNGPQHYHTTEWFPNPEQVKRQRTNDLIKAGLAVEEGITLFIFRAVEIMPDSVARILKGHLPLRPWELEDPVHRVLNSCCRHYVNRALRTTKGKKRISSSPHS